MRLTIDTRTLRDAVKIARRIMPRRSTLPILSHVLLTASDGRLTVESTNLYARTCRTLPAITAEPGAVTLPARILYDVLGAMDGEISLEAVQASIKPPHVVRLTAKDVELTIPGIAADEFPPAHELGEQTGALAMNARTLRRMIETAIRSAAPDDARPVLAGVHLAADDSGLTIATADGFRLTVQTVEAWPGDLAALVPWRTLAEIARSTRPDDVLSVETYERPCSGHIVKLPSTTTIVEAYTDRTFRIATPDGSWWTSRTIEGAFPNYQKIIPKRKTIVTRATLKADGLRRAAVLARTMSYSDIVRLDVKPVEVCASITDAENGIGSFTLPADIWGQPMHLAIRATFLRDALRGMGDRVTLEFVSPSAPVTIFEPGSTTRQFVMPMHVGR